MKVLGTSTWWPLICQHDLTESIRTDNFIWKSIGLVVTKTWRRIISKLCVFLTATALQLGVTPQCNFLLMASNLSTWLNWINKDRQLYLKIHRFGGDKDLKENNFKIVIFFATALQLGVTPQVNSLNLDLKKTQKEENSLDSYL